MDTINQIHQINIKNLNLLLKKAKRTVFIFECLKIFFLLILKKIKFYIF